MYHYRNKANRFGYTAKSAGLRSVVLLVMIVVAVLLILWLINGSGLNENNYQNQRNAKIRSEIQYATAQANSLSRLGATSSSGVLGKIRQYIHGVEVLNELNVGMYGEVGRLYKQFIFDEIYMIIDDYEVKLISGQKINDSLILLTEAIENLNQFTLDEVLR